MKPPFEMIAVDLDNTLLRPDKSLSDYTVKTLARCREKGILLMFATARPLRTIRQYMELVHPDAVAVHNGAVVMLRGEEIARHGIEVDDRRRMMRAFLRELPQHRLSAEANDTLYSNFDANTIWEVEQFTYTIDFEDMPPIPADKLLVDVATREQLHAVEAHVRPPYCVRWIEGSLAMVLNQEAEKSRAVRDAALRTGIGMERIVAFGDDVTDIPMLAACGTGIAVENALGEVKAAADALCPSCGEDGVARWLEENVL